MTIAHGRHEHLRGQAWGLRQQTRPADLYVVVAMGDPEVAAVAREQHPEVVALEVAPVGSDLPLAEARNAGAGAAIRAGADVLVFLDVDCIPDTTTVARYADVLTTAVSRRPVVACGEVSYLPPVGHPAEYRAPGLADRARPHPARPVPRPVAVLVAEDTRLFWSLSFAVTADDWLALGGFDEAYVGYGAEDTDFGQRLTAANGELLWVGGAAAYHQHHPTDVPPVHHLRAIVRNANIFHDRWGWFPMEAWLAEFATRGLAELDHATGRWRVSP
ncbi:glycosyltransferase family 2 protein [Pedococcus bigeumensis]|uniref:glycosyltransferase family 2 protein n=1 Tax=Pedococcus bigeumensis TaxID=433644 RepID=UPI001F4FFDAD|nr:galactosyltransferase-related protein [Pedococcus bigeumensis]